MRKAGKKAISREEKEGEERRRGKKERKRKESKRVRLHFDPLPSAAYGPDDFDAPAGTIFEPLFGSREAMR